MKLLKIVETYYTHVIWKILKNVTLVPIFKNHIIEKIFFKFENMLTDNLSLSKTYAKQVSKHDF